MAGSSTFDCCWIIKGFKSAPPQNIKERTIKGSVFPFVVTCWGRPQLKLLRSDRYCFVSLFELVGDYSLYAARRGQCKYGILNYPIELDFFYTANFHCSNFGADTAIEIHSNFTTDWEESSKAPLRDLLPISVRFLGLGFIIYAKVSFRFRARCCAKKSK